MSIKGKTLWAVGAGRESVLGIKRAKALGLQVVASDGDKDAPGFAFADHRIVHDTYDAFGTARLARAFQKAQGLVHGVIAMCTDVPLTVAAVASDVVALGLPLGVARLGQDKLDMKQHLQANGIPTARGWQVHSGKEVSRLMMQCGCDLVVKPMDSRGARGVTRVMSPNGAMASYDIALRNSPSGRVMAEEWLPGPQVSTEGVLFPTGEFLVPGFLDRNYDRLEEFAPYVIEDGATGPSSLPPDQQADVRSVFEQAARAVVGTVPCTVKGDMVITPNGPKVIELALRLSGGYMSTELVPRQTGVDLVGIAIRLALGEDVPCGEAVPTRSRGVAIRYLIPPGCTSHPQRLGHAICEADTREDAVRLTALAAGSAR